MADDEILRAEGRRKRVNRLKRIIIFTILFLLFIPLILSIFLLIQMQRMSGQIDTLQEQLNNIQTLLGERSAGESAGVDATITESGTGNMDTVATDRTLDGERMETEDTSFENGSMPDSAETEAIEAKHKVYLTFDDGPSKYTDDILDILDQYQVKATFFVVGKESDYSKEMLQEIVKRGHTLAMHSYTHKYTDIYKSEEAFATDFEKIRTYLYDVTGVECMYYRFPGGSSNTVSKKDMKIFKDYLSEQGVVFFDWNIASGDGGQKLLTVEKLVKNSISDVEKFETSVILLHDAAAKSTTVEALPIIIEKILAMDDTVILPITEDTEPIQHNRK